MSEINTLTAKKALSIISTLWGVLHYGIMGEMKISIENNTRCKGHNKFRIKVFISLEKKLDIDERTSELELRELITGIKKNSK